MIWRYVCRKSFNKIYFMIKFYCFSFLFILLTKISFCQLPEYNTSLIQTAINTAQAGDTIYIPAGIYRGVGLSFIRSGDVNNPITLLGKSKDSVIIKGSIIVSGWIKHDSTANIYKKENYTNYYGSFAQAYIDSLNTGGITVKFDARNKARNQIFVNGTYIPEVARFVDIKTNSFYIDKTNSILYICLSDNSNPSEQVVESSTRSFLLDTKGYNNLVIKNIQFEHCVNLPQDQAMVRLSSGSNCIIENISAKYAAGAGFTLQGNNHVVRNSIFNNNGQLGIHSVSTNNCLMENCENSFNNYLPEKQFDRGWEAGGNKFVRSRSFILRGHIAHHNNGAGIWFDIDNQNPIIENCICYENLWGIHYEISYTAIIRNNICYNNRLLGDPDSSPVGIGIYISSSAGCEVYNNITYGNETFGIQARGPIRSDGAGREVFSHSTKFYNNIIAENQAKGNYTKSYDMGYGKNPNDTTTYNLINCYIPVTPNKSDYNLFYLSKTNKEFFIGPGSSRPKTLSEWQNVSKQDSNSIWANPQFVDPSIFNFMIKGNSPAIDNGLNINVVTHDFNGNNRPYNLITDIGAFEYFPEIITEKENTSIKKSNYTIYPNPSSGLIYIKAYEKIQISIFDITGKIIYNGFINEGNTPLYFSNLEGMYIIKLNNGEFIQKQIFKSN
jgi:parallel beta-helix repeat protein